jgi:DNA-binding GntR family transcriptional regulator
VRKSSVAVRPGRFSATRTMRGDASAVVDYVSSSPRLSALVQKAYDGLLAILFSGDLRPNDVIMERQIAQKLGISRTPLREAIRRLEGEKLLERQKGGAIVVSPISNEDFLHILSVRRLLEGEAARKAAQRISVQYLVAFRERVIAAGEGKDSENLAELGRELHLYIARSSGNPVLASVIEDMGKRSRLFIRSYAPVSVPELRKHVCEEHLALIAALLDNDGERAKAAREQHIDNVRAYILDRLAAL